MAFQFQCPHGHVLETDESFAGQPCQCPYCGITFPIPHPPRPAAPHASAGAYAPPAASQPGEFRPFGGMQPAPGFQAGAAPAPFTPAQAEPELLHIACPNGHELETPRDMLNQDVLCPHCNVQFRLREKDSVEYKRRRTEEQERRERRAGKMWLNYAIVAAVLVVMGLMGLIAISMSS